MNQPLPNIKPPTPANIEYSQYMNIPQWGVFNIRRAVGGVLNIRGRGLFLYEAVWGPSEVSWLIRSMQESESSRWGRLRNAKFEPLKHACGRLCTMIVLLACGTVEQQH